MKPRIIKPNGDAAAMSPAQLDRHLATIVPHPTPRTDYAVPVTSGRRAHDGWLRNIHNVLEGL